jgi:hypothetical protein
MHNEIMHLGEARTFAEIKKRFCWHDRTYFIKEFVRMSDKCQLAKQIGNLRSGLEGMKKYMCVIFLSNNTLYYKTLT